MEEGDVNDLIWALVGLCYKTEHVWLTQQPTRPPFPRSTDLYLAQRVELKYLIHKTHQRNRPRTWRRESNLRGKKLRGRSSGSISAQALASSCFVSGSVFGFGEKCVCVCMCVVRDISI